MRPCPLVIIAGPSGVGKSTVVEQLLIQSRLPLSRAITATTRAPRPGETPGVDYHFWTVEEFEAAIATDALLEYAQVFGKDYYGTPCCEVFGPREAGKGVILVIDVQGAAIVRAKLPAHVVSCFVAPPNHEELRLRLTSRASESEERLKRRLQTAQTEMGRAGEFDTILVNANLDATVQNLERVIEAQFSLCESLAMLDDLKEEEIVNKVGGRFKLSTLIQKRMVALNTGAKPLVDLKTNDKMAIVLEEIQQDKIYLDPTGEVQTQNMTVSMNLPAPYFGGGTAVESPSTAPATDIVPDEDD